jgi:hypothetical protein
MAARRGGTNAVVASAQFHPLEVALALYFNQPGKRVLACLDDVFPLLLKTPQLHADHGFA